MHHVPEMKFSCQGIHHRYEIADTLIFLPNVLKVSEENTAMTVPPLALITICLFYDRINYNFIFLYYIYTSNSRFCQLNNKLAFPKFNTSFQNEEYKYSKISIIPALIPRIR